MSIPILSRHVFEPLYYSHVKSPFLDYARELEKTQYLSKDELLGIQWRRFKDLLIFVFAHNDFYRRRFNSAGIRPDDVRTMEDVARLPLLTKEEIRFNDLAMISNGYAIDGLMKVKTGGSTGKALEIYLTEDCSERRNACARRHDKWTGWKPGEPAGAVWGNPAIPMDFRSRLKAFLLGPYIFLDTMCISDEAVLKFAREWERIKPSLLYGHAHSIFLLAEFVRRLGIEAIRPKGIISTSMTLMPHERVVIEEVFGTKVTDRYGCEEVSLIASECERHAGMHLNIEHLLIEFVKDDGSAAAPGELGTIVVTDLMNYAMPLIRYRVEDVGIPSDRLCPCGRGLPLMEKVLGRTADFLVKNDGSRVAGISLIERLLTNNPGIYQMQVVQSALDRFEVMLVKSNVYDEEKTLKQLKHDFEAIFPSALLSFHFVENIMPEASGKYRFSICRI